MKKPTKNCNQEGIINLLSFIIDYSGIINCMIKYNHMHVQNYTFSYGRLGFEREIS